jgi:hypothetical protein
MKGEFVKESVRVSATDKTAGSQDKDQKLLCKKLRISPHIAVGI